MVRRRPTGVALSLAAAAAMLLFSGVSSPARGAFLAPSPSQRRRLAVRVRDDSSSPSTSSSRVADAGRASAAAASSDSDSRIRPDAASAAVAVPASGVSFPPVPVRSHHAAIKTRSMEMALAFYSLLGFRPEAKFRAGPARAAWLTNAESELESESESGGSSAVAPSRIEIIEVPPEVLDEAEGARKRAADRMAHPALLGLDHVCLDVTGSIDRARADSSGEVGAESTTVAASYGLSDWIDDLQSASQDRFGKALRMALQPRVKRMGRHLYEMAYIYDADGSLLELLNCNVSGSSDGPSGSSKEAEESSWDDEDDGRIVWRVGS